MSALIDQVVVPLNTRFQCPRCGGFTFGLSQNFQIFSSLKREELRHCNDDDCDFTWSPDEDWRYFRLSHAFATREEYEQMRSAVQRVLVLVPVDRDAEHQHAERQVLYWNTRFEETRR